MEKKWILLPAAEEAILQVRTALKIHPALCRLLVLRGITDYSSAKDFFRPSLSHLHDPFLMKGMTQAVSRIQKAIARGEKIMIYGDYDVDGTTSVAVVYQFLKHNFPQTSLVYYVPHRYREGYGVSAEGIQEAERLHCQLIITLDCGIKAVEKARLAREKGIDMIICDHHLPGETLPEVVAILNPKQYDCPYPYKELSGCGIGFKLIAALAEKENLSPEKVYGYLDWVATSIAADMVPVNGENRILAYFGIKRANENPSIALQQLKEVAQLKNSFTMTDLAFAIAPRINAAGRMDDAQKAISLFVEEEAGTALAKAQELQLYNVRRREEELQTTEEALSMLQAENPDRKATVLFHPNWHKGVVGIVASRVLEQYYRPTIILTESNGMITGSARSVKGFNIHHALEACAPLLENFGGHFFAAGLTLQPDYLLAFKERFEQIVCRTITEQSLRQEIEIDAAIQLKDITPSFFKLLQQFEPCGPENPQPVFITRGVRDKNGQCRILKGKHIRFVVYQGHHSAKTITGIGFSMAEQFPVIASGKPFDIMYRIVENEWQGKKQLQIQVLDIREGGG